jgi:hypothetical protein
MVESNIIIWLYYNYIIHLEMLYLYTKNTIYENGSTISTISHTYIYSAGMINSLYNGELI